MLFGVVFIEKNTKNKKKGGTFENLLPYISATEAPQDIIQPDSGSYNLGLQLLFLPF